MRIFRDAAYWAKRMLVGLYGPAELDPEHDPAEQLKREHEREVQAGGAQEAPGTTTVEPDSEQTVRAEASEQGGKSLAQAGQEPSATSPDWSQDPPDIPSGRP